MPSYILLVNWTDQGIRNVKESPKRYDAFKDLVRKHGGEVRAIYMTMGAYDFLSIVEVPSDEAMAQIAVTLGMGGNVRTTTLKAFGEDEYRRIIGAVG